MSNGEEKEVQKDNATAPPPSTGREVTEREITSPQITLSDLMNPYTYSLKHVHVKPDLTKVPLGMKTNSPMTGVVEVIAVKSGGIAAQFAIEVGSYLLCVNGRPAAGDENDLKPNSDGLRMTLARKRRHPLNPLVPFGFLGRHQRQLGCEYFVFRLNLMTCKYSAIQLVTGKGNRVCIGVATNRTAISEFGLHVGDTVIAVDFLPVRDKQHCEQLLRQNQDDIVDLTVERSPLVTIPVVNVKVSDTAPLKELSLSSSDDDDGGGTGGTDGTDASNEVDDSQLGFGLEEEFGGDPASGVPQVPADVARMVQGNAHELARKIVGAKSVRSASSQKPKVATIVIERPSSGKKNKSKKSAPRVTNPRLVKIDKAVASAKLKKQGPPTSPKK